MVSNVTDKGTRYEDIMTTITFPDMLPCISTSYLSWSTCVSSITALALVCPPLQLRHLAIVYQSPF